MSPRVKFGFVLKRKAIFYLIKKLFLYFTQFSKYVTDPEYVTVQINSRILELLSRRLCRLIFAPSRKS